MTPSISSNTCDPIIFALDAGLSTIQPVRGAGSIVKISANGGVVEKFIDGQRLPDGIDICVSSNRIFWTSMGAPGKCDGALYSASLSNGSDIRVVVPPNSIIHTPKQLVVDASSKRLYFCDRQGLRVMRCNFDGSDLKCLVCNGDWRVDAERDDPMRWCVGIAIAPALGKVFWTQKGPSKGGAGRIMCANIDMPAGATPSSRPDNVCLLSNLPEPIDLEFDETNCTLYWTDRGELPYGNTLNKVKLELHGDRIAVVPPAPQSILGAQHSVLATKFNEAIGLKLDAKKENVYVSDLGGGIYKCKLDGSGEEIVMQNFCASSLPDYEGELVFVTSKKCRDVSVEEAEDFILGYTVGNDLSCRKFQLHSQQAGQFFFAKAFDKFAPIGPMLLSPRLFANSTNLTARVNGEVCQVADFKNDMIFSPKEILSHMSQGTATMLQVNVVLEVLHIKQAQPFQRERS
ncbi:hypothetical protein SLS56_010805 [Neofusicoccum ribis]|uniref:Fumarylacetoacetase-like C-terminal domain-containing protein n=1 Tax=Neofusicoccum ribis TaxID=45134 RepID=A0ABR3SDH4_9PEZI